MQTTNLVNEKNVILHLKAKNQRDAVVEIVKILVRNGYVKDESEFVRDVLDREKFTTTGIGNGIAIPHGKSKGVIQSTVIFARSDYGIDWNSLDDKPVYNIFLMAINSNDEADVHLHQLARLSEKMMDDNFVKAFEAGNNVPDLVKILNGEKDKA
ncbi:PTS mannose transporter subunit IIAB [Companilactobacillus zhachilii]|uniref:PTS mannose transporter subunit IIAB n=1 Tax=Companilactobacillus zhachilii TaxID=2304606 RepID=A0A386PWU0_9LACO|nr:fructose PTS transporter subunit IIA [Companilactobacillus zhachilii]AYE39193.1 PTS mannose transporter subunit IIAB [Companilactobacillus zhachilii]